jgi:hypothetical protein
MAGLKLDGTLPTGLFGAVVGAHHLGWLRSWRDGLRAALADRLPTGLASIWYGAAPEHRQDIAIAPAIPLSVALPDGTRTMSLQGQSELLTQVDGASIAVTLMIANSRDSYPERDHLRAWLTHLARAASGTGGDRALTSLVLAGDREGEPAKAHRTVFPPLSREAARGHLATLAADLLRDVHPYLLPCEGVFTWSRRQRKEEQMSVREAVLLVRDDNFTHLSSDRGPIPDARRYPVPTDRNADAFVAQRFQSYLDCFGDLK